MDKKLGCSTRVDFTTRAFKVIRTLGGPRSYYWVERPRAVAIVAVAEGCVALVAQVRPAVGRELLELPAGLVDEGETPDDAAQRELQEEIGYRAGHLEQVGKFFMSPGYSDEEMVLFLATDLGASQLPQDAGEEITVKWASAEKLSQYLGNGTICDAKSIIGIRAFLNAPHLHGGSLVI